MIEFDDNQEPWMFGEVSQKTAENIRSLRTWGDSTLHAAPGLQIKRNVIDPTDGALFTGGSSWVPGMPMVASSSGLAGAIDGELCTKFGSLGNEPCAFISLTPEQEYLTAMHGLQGYSLQAVGRLNKRVGGVAKKTSAHAQKMAASIQKLQSTPEGRQKLANARAKLSAKRAGK